MFIVGFFFRSLLVNIGKNICLLFRRQSFYLLLLDVRVGFPKVIANAMANAITLLIGKTSSSTGYN